MTTTQTLPVQIALNQRTQLSPFRMQQQINVWSKRAHYLQMEKKRTKEEHEMELVATKGKYDDMIELKDSKINTNRDDITQLPEEEKELEQLLKEAGELLTEYQERKSQPPTYKDVYEGGILSNHVDAFTLLDTIEVNDAFL